MVNRVIEPACSSLGQIPRYGLLPDEACPCRHSEEFSLCNQEELLQSALSDDPPATLQHIGVIRSGYSAELDGVIERSRHAREWIASLEGVERKRTGIKTLKVGYNKVFGYYLEITRANADMAPAEYIRKQTLVNAERYITPELKEYETLVLNAEERIHEIELRLFRELCERLSRLPIPAGDSPSDRSIDACAWPMWRRLVGTFAEVGRRHVEIREWSSSGRRTR
jgi:hypothetical protein